MSSLRVALKLSMAEAKPESTKPTKKRASSLGTSFEEDALPPG